MGLLDSVMGAAGASLQGEGLQGLMGMLGQQPQLMQAAASLLGSDGQLGGLQGLIAKCQQAGLGDIVSSWVGKGDNLPITGEQISQLLGSDTLSKLSSQLGLQAPELAGQLSGVLPGLVDQLTPDGQLPAASAASGGDLMGLLGGMLKA